MKIAGNNTHCPECWSRTLTGSEFAHHSALIWQKHNNTCNVIFLHRVSTYQWFHITFCWQKCIIRESDVTWASRRLKLPVPRLFVQKIFRLRWNKSKATHYRPFFEGNRPVTGQIHLYSVIYVVKAYQSFTPGPFPSSWQQMLQSVWEKCWFIAPDFLNH